MRKRRRSFASNRVAKFLKQRYDRSRGTCLPRQDLYQRALRMTQSDESFLRPVDITTRVRKRPAIDPKPMSAFEAVSRNDLI